MRSVSVRFIIKKNTGYVDQLSLDDFIDQQPDVDVDDAEEHEAEIREAREKICNGFEQDIFAEFTLEQLEELKSLAWHNVDDEAVERYNSVFHSLVVSHQHAVADYITQKIRMCNARGKEIQSRYGFIKRAVAENYQ